MDDDKDVGRQIDEATGVPNRWFRPLVLVPLAVAVAVLLWGIFGTGWLL